MTVEVSEILDAIHDSLENRNRDKDVELVEFWAAWLKQHVNQLMELEEQDDDNDTT